MSIAEALLRPAVSLVAFLTLFVHLALLAASPRLLCNGSEPEVWVLLFALTPVTLICALLLLFSERVPAVVPYLRWGCVPVALLWPLALFATMPVLSATSLGGAPICSDGAYSSLVWQQSWAPLQLGLLLIIAVQTWRYWRMAGDQATAARVAANARRLQDAETN